MAEILDKKIEDMIAFLSSKTLEEAKFAWKAVRVPYLKTEVFRFGNRIVDD